MADLQIATPIPLTAVIRNALLNALAYTEGHQAKAAGLLGISPRRLDYKMQQCGIPRAKTGQPPPPTPRERALAKLTAEDRRALELE